MNPPGIAVCHTSAPVAALTAQSVPFQSPKYATPSATAGVPDTPVRPSLDHDFVSVATLRAVIFVAVAAKPVLERS